MKGSSSPDEGETGTIATIVKVWCIPFGVAILESVELCSFRAFFVCVSQYVVEHVDKGFTEVQFQTAPISPS